ncbi:IclR family transcriptional regulator [Massilia niastensis]|uniref:IclR family transcriptional regulator n=1 Tax=Massilia niastensis TaxID=544911 RepID=UPI0003812312|nr:helix-turn-helix domain-containing protein [Massilia niastensis]
MDRPAKKPADKPARGVSPSNRSLERGILVLRAFRPGSDLLGNGELAERTGLSRATVSRLAQTLVGTGMLEHDAARRAYRLAAPVLSLAHAMRSCSVMLEVAAPLMRTVAAKLHVNVGLAVPDQEDMVYLESVRYNSKVSLRTVVVGQRIPMELTSLGRAYLAVADDAQRRALLDRFKARQRSDWQRIEREIAQAAESVRRHGFCTAAWQPEVVALATPIVIANRPVHVLNMSVSTQAGVAAVTDELSKPLLDLRAAIEHALSVLA